MNKIEQWFVTDNECQLHGPYSKDHAHDTALQGNTHYPEFAPHRAILMREVDPNEPKEAPAQPGERVSPPTKTLRDEWAMLIFKTGLQGVNGVGFSRLCASPEIYGRQLYALVDKFLQGASNHE